MENSNAAGVQKVSSMEVNNRPVAYFHPDLWGNRFLDCSPPQEFIREKKVEFDKLKEQVRKKLLLEVKDPKDKLVFIDLIQRLGVEYHFEEELENIPLQFHEKRHQNDDLYEDDLYYVSLRFRLLRQHGFNVSSDVFGKFKDEKNGFKGGSSNWNAQDLLSLYEATYLRLHEEHILEEALEFTKIELEEMVPHLEPCLANRVLHALSRPLRKALPIIYAREFMSFYQEDEFHDQLLLNFAKLDFNLLQKQYQQELSVVSRWWKGIDVTVNFPFARDRIVECYFWIAGIHYEPQYALARKFVTKIIALTSILDDMFDNTSGIHAELELFTQAMQRWDINDMDELPKYMKLWFQTLQAVYDEMEEELATTGRSLSLSYAKNAMKNVVETYHEESKWLVGYLNKRVTPTLEEYTKIAFDSTGFPLLTTSSFVGMGHIVTKKAFDWLINKPQMLRATCVICRFMDDIVSHQLEQERDHVPSAIECIMHHEKGVSEEEACSKLNKPIEDAWKDLNAAFFDPQSPPLPLLVCLLNYARVMDLLYKVEDGYTNSSNSTKHYVAWLLHDSI